MASICSITPFTMTDFPSKLACIVWFAGCNMRCLYCYNTELVEGKGSIENEAFLDFLKKRQNKLNAVVFSGGECTLSKDFFYLLQKVKELGFETKVDTNGTNLSVLKRAIKENLIDYIALDFKALESKFEEITKSNYYNSFIKTLRFIVSSKVRHEVRTTVHPKILNEEDIGKMSEVLFKNGYKGIYYLQNFLQTDRNFGNLLTPCNSFNPLKIHSYLKVKLRNF